MAGKREGGRAVKDKGLRVRPQPNWLWEKVRLFLRITSFLGGRQVPKGRECLFRLDEMTGPESRFYGTANRCHAWRNDPTDCLLVHPMERMARLRSDVTHAGAHCLLQSEDHPAVFGVKFGQALDLWYGMDWRPLELTDLALGCEQIEWLASEGAEKMRRRP